MMISALRKYRPAKISAKSGSLLRSHQAIMNIFGGGVGKIKDLAHKTKNALSSGNTIDHSGYNAALELYKSLEKYERDVLHTAEQNVAAQRQALQQQEATSQAVLTGFSGLQEGLLALT